MATNSFPWTRALGAALLVIAGWGTHTLYPEWLQPADSNAANDTTSSEPATPATVERGAYLAKIGNCAGCHTPRDGAAYAGGRGIDTPFGTVYSSNLTSDPTYGIGAWTAQDFWNAMHLGRSRDGSVLNPAFPYTSFTHIARSDSDALFAYLRTVAPAATVRSEHAITWPLGSQLALRVWRALYFTPSPAVADAPSDAPSDAPAGGQDPAQRLARGEYLVRGLGHCFECHAERNRLGAITRNGETAGGVMPATQWFAPPLQGPATASDWSAEALSALLRTGHTAANAAANTVGTTARGVGGPMAEVVMRSTQYLSPADADAMASFLMSAVPANRSTTAPKPSMQNTQQAPEAQVALGDQGAAVAARGADLYGKHCQECHGAQGEGIAGAYPALAGNPAVNRAQFNNLALKVMRGGFAPSTAANPRPYGMPPYLLALSEADIATVITYIRSSWGNAGAAVSEFDINRLKASIHP